MIFISALLTMIFMEPVANLLHRYVWHGVLWHVHQSHHQPRKGWFEYNDIFAFMYASLSILCIFGTKHGVIQGIGWGVACFGLAYMIVHDGYIHQRFSCGFLGRYRYFRKLKAKHILHHSRENHDPFGLFWVS